jgi:hypothetical protein
MLRLAIITLSSLGFFFGESRPVAAQGSEFATAFDRLLKDYRGNIGDSPEDELRHAVAKLGTHDDIRAAIWLVLNDKARMDDWTNALLLGRNYKMPKDEILDWIRRNLELIVERAPVGMFGVLEDYLILGNLADAQRLQSLTDKLPANQIRRAEAIRTRAKSIIECMEFNKQFDKTGANEDRPTEIRPPERSNNPPIRSMGAELEPLKRTSMEPFALVAWIAILTAVIGLMLLVFNQKRRSCNKGSGHKS